MTRHFNYTEKEYRQKRSRFARAAFFCALALSLAVVGAIFVSDIPAKVAIIIIAVMLVLRLLSVDVMPALKRYIDIADRRELILRLHDRLEEFLDLSAEKVIKFADGVRYTFDKPNANEDSVVMTIPGHGVYAVTRYGVEDIDDGHIDREEVIALIREFDLRVADLRNRHALENRPAPITGAVKTQPSQPIFRP